MLVDLKQRSNEPELMDDPNISEKALQTALLDISRVNRILGGNSITVNTLHRLVTKHKTGNELLIADLGCGDGEMLRSIALFFENKKIPIQLIGIDINDRSIDNAKKASVVYPNIQFKCMDILNAQPSDLKVDIAICTLTLHHFTDKEIIQFLQKIVKMTSIAIIINDLHRNPLAYYLFKLFSTFFIKGYVAKNDGLVSIQRGFKRKDLIKYAKQLKLKNYQIRWKWAFRYRWIIETKGA